MQIQHLSTEAVLEVLRTGASGLSTPEAARRLAEFGPNHIERIRRESHVRKFARELGHLLAVILWIGAGLAFVADVLQPGEGMDRLGWAIIGVIGVNAIFSYWQMYRAERAIDSLRKLLPAEMNALRDAHVVRLDTRALVPGDLVLLEAGDLVPADCRVIESHDARLDASTLTGEALPKSVSAVPAIEEQHPLQSHNLVLAGTWLVQGRVTGVIFATGMHTELGKIAHLTQAAGEPLSPLQRELSRLSRLVAALATVLGVVFFAVGQAFGLTFTDSFVFAIGIIVANVPEGLLPTVTLATAMAAQRLARHQTLVRHLPAVEALGSTSVICTDKTGTLTENRMQARVLFVGGRVWSLDGLGQQSELARTHRTLFEGAVWCESVREVERNGHRESVGDPMEIALVEMGRRAVGALPDQPRLDEIPFDQDRKRFSTLHATPEGRVLYVKGAPEALLPRATRIQMDDGPTTRTPDLLVTYRQAQETLAADGLRVLAIAHRPVPPDCPHDRLEEDLILDGFVGLADPPRPEVPAAIETCRKAGIRVIMVTGDHAETASAIARQIGLVQSATPRVITGSELARLSDTQLQLALGAPEILFARVGADQKLRIVQALQRKGAVVAVTGDGVNDAPALRVADIGIAMGATGTDVAKDAADMILMDDNFANIVRAVQEGRGAFDNIRKFLTYILTSNIPEIVPYLAFVLVGIPLPLTIMQILAVDLGTDIVPALGLGAEPPEPDVMGRPPRPRHVRLVDRSLLGRAYVFLGVLEALPAMAAFFFVLNRGSWSWGQTLATDTLLYRQGTAACLTAIVLMQVINVYLCRSARRSTFATGLFTNRLIVLGVVAEMILILAIDYTRWGHAVFGTAPIPIVAWLFVLPFAGIMLALEEGRKLIVRHGDRPGTPGAGVAHHRDCDPLDAGK